MDFRPSHVPAQGWLSQAGSARCDAATMAIAGYLAQNGDSWSTTFKVRDLIKWMKSRGRAYLHQTFFTLLQREDWCEIYIALEQLSRVNQVEYYYDKGYYVRVTNTMVRQLRADFTSPH